MSYMSICETTARPSFRPLCISNALSRAVGIIRPLFSVFETVPINSIHIVLCKPTIPGQGHIVEGLIHTSPLKTRCVTRFTRETRGWTGYFLTSCMLYITAVYERYIGLPLNKTKLHRPQMKRNSKWNLFSYLNPIFRP